MIAIWMLYCLGIGLAFTVVGFALERALHYAGHPTRWAWIIAMAGTYLVPAAAWLRPEAFATFSAPLAVAESTTSPSAVSTSTTSTLGRPSQPVFSLDDLDQPLRWAWALGSLALVSIVAAGAARLLAARRRWRVAAMQGREILISANVGPAVIGLWSPRIVVPEWALDMPERERELMLVHEEQHLRVRDPLVLAAALLLVVLAPWNPATWWQWRRLRRAVEMDCDARVLRDKRSTAVYGELLLRVGRRRSTPMIGVAAFGEPASFLESRIQRMLAVLPRWRWAGAAVAALVTIAAIIVACETPRPMGPVASQPVVTSEQVFTESSLDERPQILTAPTLIYPELLRRAGVEGRVLLQAIIDTLGSPERASVRVISSPNPGLEASAKQWISGAIFRAGRVHGRAVRVLVNIPCDFRIHAPSPESSTGQTTDGATLADRMAVQNAERLRSWVAENARRMMPSILEPSGPSGDAFLVHDSRMHVYSSSLVTMYYLGGRREQSAVDVARLKDVLPSFNPGQDGWGQIDPRGLYGLVRDNVRVFQINHDPQPQDTSGRFASGVATDDVKRWAEKVQQLARQYHPEMFGQSVAPGAVALVLDSRDNVIAHQARVNGGAASDDPRVDARDEHGGSSSHDDCLGILTRLVPQYRNAQWKVTGCGNDPQTNLTIYWGKLLKP